MTQISAPLQPRFGYGQAASALTLYHTCLETVRSRSKTTLVTGSLCIRYFTGLSGQINISTNAAEKPPLFSGGSTHSSDLVQLSGAQNLLHLHQALQDF